MHGLLMGPPAPSRQCPAQALVLIQSMDGKITILNLAASLQSSDCRIVGLSFVGQTDSILVGTTQQLFRCG